MTDLRSVCDGIAKAVLETEDFIKREALGFDISRTEVKGMNDFVSYVDKKSEEMLVEKLRPVVPEAGFIAEEGTSSGTCARYCWIIDPLDGTTNFVHGLQPYAISVALTDNGEPVAGVICNAGGGELFRAWKNGGAWLNDKPIKVSSANRLSDSLIATGFPYNDFSRLEGFIKSLSAFCRTTHGMRRLGSASIDMAYVACGRFEAFYEYDLKIWDVAAGIVLVREAGGRVSDFSGREKDLDGSEIIASNKNVYNEFQEIVSKFMS
ncbi:MAG TPA: inositol monophosphatase family protein [Bacteroidales bacterium]|nr:inositol monophosphatase family protein [Bacteroidales bacterium]HPF03329.1 inositol monophosphatase family protein [Bacteroidales bacterium]HPJ59174.1 inositol monophosphatase family protein [Bacteroidales bacterium]HPR12786.1 inositol monophosphatase family protein [Bacteroidales bacterium]HRW84390.1 inositol monophosphatase family protein [Bacteroidales bacterium]